MGDYTFNLRLWVKHPDADLSEVPSKLGVSAHRLWKKGDIRKAPDGRVQGGHYRDSYCCIEFARKETDLPSGLITAVMQLQAHENYLKELHQRECVLSFFVGWHSGFNSREVLNWKILKDLAALHISLDLDFYGPDPAEPPA